MSRREAIKALGMLSVLMGVPDAATACSARPTAPSWLKYDPSMVTCANEGPRITVEDLMKMMEEMSKHQSEPCLSDCIHVMNPNRMADLGGCTVMSPIREITTRMFPVTITRSA
jgi:hypothetical protein